MQKSPGTGSGAFFVVRLCKRGAFCIYLVKTESMRCFFTLLIFLSITPLVTAQSFPHEGCITSTDGTPVHLATLSTIDGAVIATTNESGCYTVQLTDSLVELQIRAPHHVYREVMSISGRPLAIELPKGSSPELTDRAAREEAFMRGKSPFDISRPETDPVPASDAVMASEMVHTTPGITMSAAPEPVGKARTSAFASRRADRVSLPDAGTLTAGEINDFTKWTLWEDISQAELHQYRNDWPLFADHRYTVQVVSESGAILADEPVELIDSRGRVLWEARTDNTGKAELWAGFNDQQKTIPANLRLRVAGKSYHAENAQPFQQGINFLRIEQSCRPVASLDIAFVVDATGSMSDEIAYLQSELLDVIERIQDTLGLEDVRLGSVFYRDQGDTYLTKHSPLSGDFSKTIEFIRRQEADGGGDMPEAVPDALETALNELSWNTNSANRLLFLVLDAPPHQNSDEHARLKKLIRQAAAQGIRIIPVACSGINKTTEYLLRTMALATNGTYTFLTDHSGVGNPHLEPTTDEYDVEKLNDVIVRLAVQFGRSTTCEPPVAQHTEPLSNDPVLAWSFWPNPSEGIVNLKSDDTEATLYLTDQNGKLLERHLVRRAQERLRFDQYPAGVYYLRLESADGRISNQQLIIM